jgi:hypothetical protein
MEASIWIRCA